MIAFSLFQNCQFTINNRKEKIMKNKSKTVNATTTVVAALRVMKVINLIRRRSYKWILKQKKAPRNNINKLIDESNQMKEVPFHIEEE